MKQIRIILVEDDSGHALLIMKNLRRSGISDEITVFDNGQSVLDFFNSLPNERAHAEFVIILDLNLPVLDGHQVLKKLKSDHKTKSIPVIILTTTDVHQDIRISYELGCNIFITKPTQYDKFCITIQTLGMLLSIMEFPILVETNSLGDNSGI